MIQWIAWQTRDGFSIWHLRDQRDSATFCGRKNYKRKRTNKVRDLTDGPKESGCKTCCNKAIEMTMDLFTAARVALVGMGHVDPSESLH